MSFSQMSLTDLAEGIQKKNFSSKELVSYFLDRVESYDSKLNSFISVNERALEEAKAQDVKKTNSLLAGVPISLKDNFCTEGLKTTAASKILSSFVPAYDSTVAKRLKNQGMIILGKNNMDEFAMGSSTETSYFQPSYNPWNREHTPGGSSGGSAASVAGGLVPASMGTDTGGSVRQPACFCGLVGLKPTYGRISRYGIIAYASSLDQAGTLTKTVEDSACLLQILSGFDEKDSTSSLEPVLSFSNSLKRGVKNLKIGVLKLPSSVHVESDALEIFDKAVKVLKDEGSKIISVELKYMDYFPSVYYIIAPCEASSNLSRYDGVRYGFRSNFSERPAQNLEEFYSRTRGEGFGQEVKRRILMGTYALSSGYYDAYYLKACRVRSLIQKDYLENFKTCDVILSPPSSSTAPVLYRDQNDPIKTYTNDLFTLGVNLAGLPALTCPIALSAKTNLPFGVQIIAAPFREEVLFQVGQFLEDHFEFYKTKPQEFFS